MRNNSNDGDAAANGNEVKVVEQNVNITPLKSAKQINEDRKEATRNILRNHPKYKDNPDLLEQDLAKVSLPDIWRHPDFPLDDNDILTYDITECCLKLEMIKRLPKNYKEFTVEQLRELLVSLVSDKTVKKEFDEKEKIMKELSAIFKSHQISMKMVKEGEKILKTRRLLK